ncbi:TRP-domain-containing protein [Eremomyces bilateralis CBS 781.70]|uniref:TRP-domain-containing protein n=1 Tax=Eremomyces bilateralis CBS 781.70 TaxID=1392243 RepID=A0A6G1G6H0_9PEZI|nr:TRP-domain-containing protein [Eremomyces bilateralis CBS 781.70]KAF1813480.1 TRP-domain-containing protein [Eremomyces bilateralis CBS 781.70]
MHFSNVIPSSLLLLLPALIPSTSADRLLQSTALSACMKNPKFSASRFNVLFTPDDAIVHFNVTGNSLISGNVTAALDVFAYGYKAVSTDLNPCDSEDLAGLCPMNTGPINIKNSNAPLSEDVIKQVPGIAYTVPDLDGKVRIYINDSSTNEPLACLEAVLSNGKTVYQPAVGWSTAVIAGIGLVASAITSGLGHSNTAAHVAANALSLFGYFQAQAFIGMSSVHLPPIVSAWTQNFQWSMGIVRVGFLQRLCTWYQRATGGTPTDLFTTLATTSVQVQKRSLGSVEHLAKRAFHTLGKRTNNEMTNAENLEVITIRGIERVGFKAKIDSTNIFMTGYTFFIIFIIFVIAIVAIFKGVVEALVKSGRMKNDKFQDFRNGWTTVLKGILFRCVLIGFPQMVVLCFWELTKRDSAAEVVLAIFTIITMLMILGWATFKVWRIAQRSISMHKNPAYILYSDPVSLNKWGFLYVQFKATAYYFIAPILLYLLIKGLFIALVQGSGKAQAVALVIIEAALLIALSVMRPYMDKKTNAFNISIAAINFISALFLLIFSNIFNQPGLVTGVMGVVFFVFNAVFALVLLLMVLVASIYALVSKNPDTRYQPMRDDRGSFIKSQTNLATTELDALGATARGDGKHATPTRRNIDDDDDESFSSGARGQVHAEKAQESGYYGAGSALSQAPSTTTYQSAGGFGGSASPAPPYSNSQYSGYNSRGPVNRGATASPSPFQRGVGYD